MPRPIPRAAPVTSAIFPAKRIVVHLFRGADQQRQLSFRQFLLKMCAYWYDIVKDRF
jgi:hypothetical protein